MRKRPSLRDGFEHREGKEEKESQEHMETAPSLSSWVPGHPEGVVPLKRPYSPKCGLRIVLDGPCELLVGPGQMCLKLALR